MDLELPAGFTDLLQEFTVQVLQDKPDDIVEFAANYFMKLKLKEKRSKDGTKRRGKGVSFQSEEVNGDENSDDEDDEEDMGKKNYWLYNNPTCSILAIDLVPIFRKKFKKPLGVYFTLELSLSVIPPTWDLISYSLQGNLMLLNCLFVSIS